MTLIIDYVKKADLYVLFMCFKQIKGQEYCLGIQIRIFITDELFESGLIKKSMCY